MIIALTAGAYGDDEREALSYAGADSFLRKPYDERTLVDRLVRVLEARHKRRRESRAVRRSTTAAPRRRSAAVEDALYRFARTTALNVVRSPPLKSAFSEYDSPNMR